jgi:hypothetical protein
LREREGIPFNTSDDERCVSRIFNVSKKERAADQGFRFNTHGLDVLTERRHVVPTVIVGRELVGLADVDEVLKDGEEENAENSPECKLEPNSLEISASLGRQLITSLVHRSYIHGFTSV